MAKSTKNTRFRMTKQQDAINKRMRGEEIKLQRRKRLWQKRRSLINGVGLFAALPIRAARRSYPNCAIKKKRGGLWLTSIRPIEQGEELLIDYDFDLGEEFEPCRCGHPRCRGIMLRRKDWPKLRRLMSKVL
jgi:hypothetical protein